MTEQDTDKILFTSQIRRGIFALKIIGFTELKAVYELVWVVFDHPCNVRMCVWAASGCARIVSSRLSFAGRNRDRVRKNYLIPSASKKDQAIGVL